MEKGQVRHGIGTAKLSIFPVGFTFLQAGALMRLSAAISHGAVLIHSTLSTRKLWQSGRSVDDT